MNVWVVTYHQWEIGEAHSVWSTKDGADRAVAVLRAEAALRGGDGPPVIEVDVAEFSLDAEADWPLVLTEPH